MTPSQTEDQLSATEWLLYGALFTILPMLNILVSSMLYYRWRDQTPGRAGQINKLGWAIFGIQILFGILRDTPNLPEGERERKDAAMGLSDYRMVVLFTDNDRRRPHRELSAK